MAPRRRPPPPRLAPRPAAPRAFAPARPAFRPQAAHGAAGARSSVPRPGAGRIGRGFVARAGPRPRLAPRPGAQRHAPAKLARKGPAHHPGAKKRPARPRAHAASATSLGRFDATAYGPPWDAMQGSGVTATGIDLRPARHAYIVAVDPSVIPMHTKLRITPNPFGNDNIVFSAEDTGGAIKGHHIDFYDWRGRNSQLAWGVRQVTVERMSGVAISDIPAIGGIAAPDGGGDGGGDSQPADNYVNPLSKAKVTPERIDQGVDYAGTGEIVAIADGDVSAVTPGGWGKFGNYIEYKITQPGELEGVYIFVAEGVDATVRYGQHIQAGDTIAKLIPGWPYGIEMGFAAGDGRDHTYFFYHDGDYSRYDGESAATRPGIAFSNLVERLGGPPGKIEGPVVGNFPEYMPSGEPAPGVQTGPPDTFVNPVGGGINLSGQFDWPGSVLSAFVQLQRGALAGSHHSHAAWFYARGVEYVPKSAT